MPLWTDAYLGDTTHLTTLEHGAYLLLLMTAWRAKDGALPNNDKLLSRYAKLTLGQWKKIKTSLEPFFSITETTWTQGRLMDEREAVRQKSKRQSHNSKARWLKNKETDKPRDRSGIPTAIPPIPIPIPLKNKEKIYKKENVNFEEFWKICPRKVGKGKAEEKYTAALREVSYEDLMKSMKAHAKEMKTKDMEFIPHPATWLHQKRYLDEIPKSYEPMENWPPWKINMAKQIGENPTKSWFGECEVNGSSIKLKNQFQANYIRANFLEAVKIVFGEHFEVQS